MLTTINLDEGKKIVRAINRCIYCGALDDLSEEHIIPIALNGTQVLLKASCSKHRDITGKFEGLVLRKHLLPVRAGLKLKTRKPRNRPKSFAVELLKDGKLHKVDVPIEKQPQILALPKFRLPTYLFDPQDYLHTQGITVLKTPSFAIVGGPTPENFHQWLIDNGYTGIDIVVTTTPLAFALMLGKIAYCLVVGEFGLDAVSEAYVLPALNAEKNDIGRWVGCTGEEDNLPSVGLHRLKINVTDSYEVFVRIKLFALFETPTYSIAVGRVNKDVLDNLNRNIKQTK